MSQRPFEPSRADGRSDRRVLLDLIGEATPGSFFAYAELERALSEGTDREITRRVVGAAARAADRSLLAEQSRSLVVVPTRGYRVIAASEHLPVALEKKERASGYIERGMRLLKQVRWDELDTNVRKAHEGHLMVLAGLSAAIDHHEQRLDKHEEIIAAILRRVSPPAELVEAAL